MNGHGNLSKAEKCWEQTIQCLSVTTSVMCDSPLQKIPTAVFEQRIQPSLECTSLGFISNSIRGRKQKEETAFAFSSLMLISVRGLKYDKVSWGRLLFQPMVKPKPYFPTFSQPVSRPCILPISSGYSLLFSSLSPNCLSVLMVEQLQQRSHRQAIKQRCLRGMSQHPSCCHQAIFINQLTWERINNKSSTLQHYTVISGCLELGLSNSWFLFPLNPEF